MENLKSDPTITQHAQTDFVGPIGQLSSQERKERPIASGVLYYFPNALAEVAYCSKKGDDQHNPGQPLHWAKGKSTDHADCILRHLIDAGTFDSDGVRHSAKVAWRALALLQTEIEREREERERSIRPYGVSEAETARAGPRRPGAVCRRVLGRHDVPGGGREIALRPTIRGVDTDVNLD